MAKRLQQACERKGCPNDQQAHENVPNVIGRLGNAN